jgi:MarR family transcriptional regulator, lower aerobic nicotinate degradation pathway regulator
VTDEPADRRPVSREDLGFLLAKATQRWNELLAARFTAAGFAEVRPSYGSVLVPLFEEDGLRLGELARRARLSKQTMTTMVRLLERDGLVRRERDPADGRAFRVSLTAKGKRLEPVAAGVLEELEKLARGRLGDGKATALRAALREMVDLD